MSKSVTHAPEYVEQHPDWCNREGCAPSEGADGYHYSTAIRIDLTRCSQRCRDGEIFVRLERSVLVASDRRHDQRIAIDYGTGKQAIPELCPHHANRLLSAIYWTLVEANRRQHGNHELSLEDIRQGKRRVSD